MAFLTLVRLIHLLAVRCGVRARLLGKASVNLLMSAARKSACCGRADKRTFNGIRLIIRAREGARSKLQVVSPDKGPRWAALH